MKSNYQSYSRSMQPQYLTLQSVNTHPQQDKFSNCSKFRSCRFRPQVALFNISVGTIRRVLDLSSLIVYKDGRSLSFYYLMYTL